jgi:hypothetical protein
MRVIDLCAWCSQQGHTEEGCRNPKYCNLCAEDTHPRKDCDTYKNRKAAEKAAVLEAEAKAKVESLQATPAPQDPVFPDPPARGRGRGRGRGTPPAVNPAPLPGPTPAAFAGVGGLEESRADWVGRGRGRGRGAARNFRGTGARQNAGRGTREPYDPFQDEKCIRCGDPSHDSASCPSRSETCTHCGKYGHTPARRFQLLKEMKQKEEAAQRSPIIRAPRYQQQPAQRSQVQAIPQAYQHPPYQMGGGGQAPSATKCHRP